MSQVESANGELRAALKAREAAEAQVLRKCEELAAERERREEDNAVLQRRAGSAEHEASALREALNSLEAELEALKLQQGAALESQRQSLLKWQREMGAVVQAHKEGRLSTDTLVSMVSSLGCEMLLLAGVEQESGRTQSAEQQEGSSVLENMIREAGAEEVVKLPLDGVRHSPPRRIQPGSNRAS